MAAKPKSPRGGEMANPSRPLRWAMSRMLARAADPDRIAARRAKLEEKRRRAGAPLVVEYFHQVDDLHGRRPGGPLARPGRLGQLLRTRRAPVERCYSLYPWAVAEGRGVELLGAFMRAAFREGINTNTDAGLRHVVEAAGLAWAEAQSIVGKEVWNDCAWRDEIEANRRTMYDLGLWGVPSFRLLDVAGETRLRVWGQDRLWLVAQEIQRALARRS